MIEDAYSPASLRIAPASGNKKSVITYRDGKIVAVEKERDDNFSKWKGSQRIMAIRDEMIAEVDVRHLGKTTYTIDGGTVTYGLGSKKNGYFCGHPGHGSLCPHVKRVQKLRKENAA